MDIDQGLHWAVRCRREAVYVVSGSVCLRQTEGDSGGGSGRGGLGSGKILTREEQELEKIVNMRVRGHC